MSESYEFVEATPVKRPGRQGAGRRAEPNPFESAVRAIAGQVDSEGTPLARETRFVLDAANGEELKQRQARIRRFLTRAGKVASAERHNGETDHVSITLVVTEVEGQPGTYSAKFWDRAAAR